MNFNKSELLKRPNYLLTKYQNEIFRQLVSYMNSNKFSQKDIAEKLNVSNSYVSQVLNGNFNFTLKKLIEFGLMMGKVPSLEFLNPDEFWDKQSGAKVNVSITVNIDILQTTLIQLNLGEKFIHFDLNRELGHSATADIELKGSKILDYSKFEYA